MSAKWGLEERGGTPFGLPPYTATLPASDVTVHFPREYSATATNQRPASFMAGGQLNCYKEYDSSQGKRDAVIPQRGKTRITIFLDDDILETFRERADSAGRGYQNMLNEALREYLSRSSRPIDEDTLRRALREES